MSVDVIRFADLVVAPWKNGGGVTRELAAWPPGAGTESFDWRVSIADVSADGPFSTFAGVDRSITLIQGTGMNLTVDGVQRELLLHAPFAFPGEAETTCTLASGATRDLNVMTRRGRARATVQVHEVNPPVEVAVVPNETLLLVTLTGGVVVTAANGDEFTLAQWDTVRCDAGCSLAVGGVGSVAAVTNVGEPP